MQQARFSGIISPVLTPFEANGDVATDLFCDHAAWTLEQGAHYISPFGTTGEAASIGLAERIDLMQKLCDAGIDPARMMPGTGLNALPDTVELTAAAMDLGCAAVMVLPPHYYPAGDDGLFRYFSALIEEVGRDDLRICLYHIPQMTGVPLSPALAARLNEAFPEQVTAYKDSGGDWSHSQAVIRSAPGIAVFPASENALVDGLELGAAGCISATCNSQISRIRAYWDARMANDNAAASALAGPMVQHRETVQAAGFIPALKSMMADRTGNPVWLNRRPPCDNAPPEPGRKLNAELA